MILEKLKLDKKGQAAITDALFFLTIIVVLSVLMFKYSSTYGEKIEQATSNLYFKEYSNSALKTIFYSEVPLNFSQDINSTEESDYLMMSIKEDFFSDNKIGNSDINSLSITDNGDIAKFNLYHTIKAIMNPLPGYDYLFYLLNSDGDPFYFFLIKTTNFINTSGSNNKFQVDYEINPNDPYSYYLCEPTDYTHVRDLISNVDKIYSSSTPLVFYNKDSEETEITATFAMWPATATIQDGNLTIPEMNCKKIANP